MRKKKRIYCSPSFAIDCIPIFFNPVFKVHFDRFLNGVALKIVMSILLKYIGNDLAMVLVIYEEFQSV